MATLGFGRHAKPLHTDRSVRALQGDSYQPVQPVMARDWHLGQQQSSRCRQPPRGTLHVATCCGSLRPLLYQKLMPSKKYTRALSWSSAQALRSNRTTSSRLIVPHRGFILVLPSASCRGAREMAARPESLRAMKASVDLSRRTGEKSLRLRATQRIGREYGSRGAASMVCSSVI